MICRACGTLHGGHTALPGSGALEGAGLVFAWPLGAFYSVWRRSSRRPACAACGSRDLVPRSSPAGRELEARYGLRGVAPPPMPQRPRPRVLKAILVALVPCALIVLLLGLAARG